MLKAIQSSVVLVLADLKFRPPAERTMNGLSKEAERPQTTRIIFSDTERYLGERNRRGESMSERMSWV